MKVLFIVPYPTEGASNRFRVEQYLPYLSKKGVVYKVRPFISSKFYRILYLRGYSIKKSFLFFCSTITRIFDIFRAFKYDVIFIHRESYPFGHPFIERILKFFNKRIIFDFDDAIFLPTSSGSNLFMERFNRYGKVPEVIALSDQIIAGNKYLADFALKYNENVTIIPTAVDTGRYVPCQRKEDIKKVVVGWIGSKTTSIFLELMRKVFKTLLDKYPDLEIKIVGGNFDSKGMERIKEIPWSLKNEIEVLQSFDIGIMPMPDTRWTRGKCAFKAILYMSVGIPCVCSPVGITADIIKDGINGFMAGSEKEWFDKLSLLIEDPQLRRKIGLSGREFVEKTYSLNINALKFINILRRVSNQKV